MSAASEPIEPHWAELNALVSRAEQNRTAMAALHAERSELCAEAFRLVTLRVAQRQAAGVARDGSIPLREMIAEVSAALRVSERTLHKWVTDGVALVATYPATLAALREGRIDERHASAIVDAGTGVFEPEAIQEYEETVLAIAEKETAPRLRRHAEIIAARLQPDAVDERQQRAFETRRVRMFSTVAGMSRLIADLPAAITQAIFDRLTEMADALDTAEPPAPDSDGADADASTSADTDADPAASADSTEPRDDRTVDQRRADIFSDLLLCGTPQGHGDPDALGAIRGTVQVTVPVLTLAGIGDEPALLDGHGPIDADTARTIAASAPGWDRVMFHPCTGEPLAVDRYRPSARLRRYLEARDQHCRWPGCRRKAVKCDADHTVAYKDGGKTTPCNLCLLCRGHHVLKHASAWHICQLGGGHLEFTSPTGRTYRNDAPPVVQFVPRPDLWDIAPDPGDPPPF